MDAVLVSFNSVRDLERLFACRPLTSAFDRLIVVDNGSDDRSADLAERAGAVVLRRPTRRGYGAAVNLGWSQTNGPLVAILNPDVRFTDPETARVLRAAFEDPDVAIAAPSLKLPDGSSQDSARRVPTPAELLLRRRLASRRGAIERAGDVPWVVGACIVVRRTAFESVGGFDEGYDLYFEDVDLCVRLRQAGWRIVYEPSVSVLHDHRAESRRSLLGWPTRAHVRAAGRFYRRHPRYVLGRDT